MLKEIRFEVHNIDYGEFVLDTDGEFLHVKRSYRLLDENGENIWDSLGNDNPYREYTIEISLKLSDIPSDVLNSLIQIDDFVKQRIKIREGIEV